jgi:hypothetical protein
MTPLKLLAPFVLAAAVAHPLTGSRQLWATIDLCGTAKKPSTLGIRGSMPSDGHPKDVMYMRFRVQYLDPATKAWANVSRGGDSGAIRIGRADAARQGGYSFQLAATGKSSFTLRGLVRFQWRRGATVVASASRTTSAGHRNAFGAEPRGYSAAVCTLS